MAKVKFTIVDVADRLEQAAATLKRLPRVTVQGHKSTWPPMLREFMDAYGWDGARCRLGPPTSSQIDEMDEAMRWLLWLERYEVQLVWLRAGGARWKNVCYKLGFCESKLRTDWQMAIIKITLFLNLEPVSSSLPYKKLLKTRTGNCCTGFEGFLVRKAISSRNVRAKQSQSSS